MNLLNKFKRGMAALLSLSVAVSAVFVFHFPLIRAHAEENSDVHTSHCFCGESDCDHDYVDWLPLTNSTEETEETEETEQTEEIDLPTAGCFYLESDLELKKIWNVSGNLTLCLNGNSIIMTASGAAVSVTDGGSFTLCDCKDNGVITHEDGADGRGVDVEATGTFNMYSGKISNNEFSGNDGGGVYNKGTFNMYGGTIIGNKGNALGGGVRNNGTFNLSGGTIINNTATSQGGGVYNNGTFNMTDGTIVDNTAAWEGGGVYNDDTLNMSGGTIIKNTATSQGGGGVYNENTMNVSGTVNITGNTGGNVYLPQNIDIVIVAPLQGTAKIGVTTAKSPIASDITIANSTDEKNYRLFFESDNKDFYVVYDKENENIRLSTSQPDADDGAIVPEIPEEPDPEPDPDPDPDPDPKPDPDKETHTPHGGDNDETEWEAVTTLPESAGHYYVTKDFTIPDTWTPDEDGKIYLCLNGYNITGTIPVTTDNLVLCDCKGSDTSVNVTVSEDKTIAVGEKLKASITLSEGALIDVDGALEEGASITVAINKKLDEDKSVAISTENAGEYSECFDSKNKDYEVVVDGDGIISLYNPKTEKPPVIDPPVDPDKHTHPICGGSSCKDHIDIEWTEWDRSDRLPTEAGSYYLTGNVTLGSRWNAASDINLCLNGYTITMNANDTAVYVTQDLAICDCGTRTPNGAITHAANRSGRGVYIAPGGALTMYGGTIKGNRSENGAGVYNDGAFTMRGGFVTGNTATNAGGGLYNSGVAVVEGSIDKNTAKKGGGVFQDGKLTVNKNAYIMKNTLTSSSSKNNVYLTDGSQIVIGGSSFDGEVGVTLETNPKSGSTVTFAKGAIGKSTADKIKSDSSSFTIKVSGDKLTISRKSSSSNYDDDDLELEISAPLSSSSIPKADRTAIINRLKTMPNWVVGAYYDVTLWEDYDEVSEHSSYIEVELNIPSSIRAANRVYKVIRIHDGEATVLDDIDDDPNTVTVRSKLFSTYAIIYNASQNGAAPGTGNGTGSGTSSNGGYTNPSMGVQNEIPLAGLACGFTVLALAAPGKKLDQ